MTIIYGSAGNDSLIGTADNDVLIGDPQSPEFLLTVSSSADGTLGDGSSNSPVFSPDGSTILFVSQSSNLINNEVHYDYQVYLKNIFTGEVSLISTSSAGVRGFQASDLPRFTPDGNKVVFMSTAANLVPGDTNVKNDLFLKDLATGVVTRLTTTSAGQQANGDSSRFDVSPDGTKIVFDSLATNLVAGDTNDSTDVFLKDLVTGIVTRISTSATGVEGNQISRGPVFSPDGSNIAFESFATNLLPGDAPGSDIFLKNLITGVVTNISTNAAGEAANGSTQSPVFSPDGTKIVFESAATNLVPSVPSAGETRLYMKDLVTGAVTLLSANAAGQPAPGNSFGGEFSPSGNSVIVVNTSNTGQTRSYIKDLTTGALFNVSDIVGPSVGTQLVGQEFSPDGTGFSFYAYSGGIAQSYYYRLEQLGSGADSLNGGSGIDSASYETALQSVRVNLTVTSGLSNLGDALGDTYTSIERFYLSDFNDTFIGSGNDDVVLGGAGADNLNGGAGINDALLYFDSNVGVTVNLQLGTGIGGTAQGDVIQNFENVAGSDFSDILTGNATDNSLAGFNGNDNLNGGAGDDRLEGGAGADTLNGGSNTAFGDLLDYFYSPEGVTINLLLNTAAGGDATGDIISNFENILGSNFLDNLTGSVVANVLEGGEGNDVLNGGAGSDTLYGDAGQDVIVVGNGLAGDTDVIDGGTERDLLDMSALTNGGVWIDFGYNLGPNQLFTSNGFAAVTNLESMIGTSFKDIMRGDRGSNFIDGGAGDDQLLSYSAYDTLTPYASLGDVILGGAGNDLLFSGAGNDYLDGGADNDTIEVGGGNDTIITGSGNDTIFFSPRCGTDTITDFTAGAGVVDVLKLYGFGADFDTHLEVFAASTQVGANTHISLTDTTIILQNFTRSTLVADDFVFV
jgi:Tol biopolymer transport system component